MSTQSDSRFLIETPPYCRTVECYIHGDGVEHHVAGCEVYGSTAQVAHRLSHAVQAAIRSLEPLVAAVEAEMRRTVRGRLLLAFARFQGRWPAKRKGF